jgi:outer membrane protein assembly factor BamB
VVSYFGSYGLICYNVAGEERWRHPLPVANTLGQYGSSASPIIAGGRVFVNRHEHGEASLLALDLATGAKAWEIARPLGSGSFGTPVVWRNANADEIVVGATGRLQGYAMRDGAERWRVDGLSTLICTTPVAGDGMLFMGAFCNASADEPLVPWEEFVKKHDRNGDGVVDLAEFPEESRDYYRGYDANLDGRITREDWDSMNAESGHRENVLLALKPGGRGDITQTHVAWKFRRGLPDVSSPLYYDGRIYLVKDGGIVSSIDAATGKPYYAQERLGGGTGNYYASPVAAADRIYFASVPGKVTVIKTGGDKPAVLHTAEFGERIIATPAIVGDRFYLRTEKQLWAF